MGSTSIYYGCFGLATGGTGFIVVGGVLVIIGLFDELGGWCQFKKKVYNTFNWFYEKSGLKDLYKRQDEAWKIYKEITEPIYNTNPRNRKVKNVYKENIKKR